MVIRRIILILISFVLIGIFLFNYQNTQKLDFCNKKFLKEVNDFNKEFFLLKEIAINLEKFRLFFESLYLNEIKRLIKESEIFKDSVVDIFVNNLAYLSLSSKVKKEDMTVFGDFRNWLKEKEKVIKEELNKLEIKYQILKNQKKKQIYFGNIILVVGFVILIVLTNIFLSFRKNKEKISNYYLSSLELLKIVKEKIDKYLEKINLLENRTKEFCKSLEETQNLDNLQLINNYKRILTYYLLNFQLGLLQNDQSLINRYSANFKEICEKIIGLVFLNNKEELKTYFKENKEELNFLKEELENLKKIVDEIKNYEIFKK